ncbi:MAG TPA: terminase small subunit [Lachnospiraceae bacterium]|nr:terminase small subunit [Lachnospiraceae bacterium]
MTEKQKRFVDEYIIDLNATRAYKAVYKNIKNDETARVNGSRLLTNANVKKYIDEQLQEISDGKIADATEVMKYLTAVLRGEEKEEVIVVEGCGDGCSSAVRVNKGIGAKDRIKAAELLGKRYSIFTDKVQVEGTAVVQIIDDIPGGDGNGKA